jgi:hypothetical protein
MYKFPNVSEAVLAAREKKQWVPFPRATVEELGGRRTNEKAAVSALLTLGKNLNKLKPKN